MQHSNSTPPSHSRTAQGGATVYRGAKSRSRKKRRRIGGLCVMAVLVVVLFVAALLLTRGSDAVSAPASVPVPQSAPQASTPAIVPPVSSVSQAPPRTPTPYDEEGLPALYNYIGRNFIPDDYELDLVDVGNGQRMQRRAAEAYLAMVDAAAADGITLRALSGYRSHDLQTNIYYNKLNLYLSQGMSQEQAEAATLRYHAYPGTSEHEAGLAMDIGDPSVPGTDIEDGFGETPAFAWLQQHAVEYGFIFRYQSHTEAITGIAYEPWHYRYVGANYAEQIVELGVTLEEYIELSGENGAKSANSLPAGGTGSTGGTVAG